ncbi:protein PLASTID TRANSCRIPTIONALLY ACTIVE 16, chloroplastic [Punica granatum]|uniref:Protein PLASTID TRANSCRIPTIONALLY ACTIVE 16, chloroplastic n=2 Tax=Punica granatum TaxID=22663 RepID=A0A6P8CNW4_PUNGR|nr:protein PLASTID TRANSCRIPTIONALLY ACTIVE 16, chloroplastic [Punica granatum]XP_031386008.1 protein PLASTID TRANSCRIPTIONALLY ACTIVE 16, chloroplastic [Punica granatum]PKI32717.1 hypothetical protein CRG98_046891 [Punica granatum]
MAPTLTSSNSFLLRPTPLSRATALRTPRLTVFANKADDDAPPSGGFSPFGNFNFGKIPDVKSLVPVVSGGRTSPGLSFGNLRRKDPGTVFVAGASGQAGIRIAQKLLREGFSVRAGVPELSAAQELAQLAATYKIISNEESKRLNAVESAFGDAESIAKAIGNASKVVVTIGPTEYGPSAEVNPFDALSVVEGAKLAGVGHVAIIYDGGTGGSTYNVLDGISSFFNNLFARTQTLTFAEFLEKVVEADVSYTLIKTKLTEDYSEESEYAVVVANEGSSNSSANDYKVAKSQIAALVADVFSNTAVAENKVVEVFTDPSASSKPMAELFGAIPEDGRRKAYAEALAKAKAEEEAQLAAEKARVAAEAAKKLEEEVKRLSQQEAVASDLAEEAREKADAAGISMESIFNKAKDFGSGLSLEKFGSQIANAGQKPVEKPEVQIATVRGQAKARNLPALRAVVKKAVPTGSGTVMVGPPAPKPKPKPTLEPTGSRRKEEPKKEVRKVFGGLFQQETIYVDDD